MMKTMLQTARNFHGLAMMTVTPGSKLAARRHVVVVRFETRMHLIRFWADLEQMAYFKRVTLLLDRSMKVVMLCLIILRKYAANERWMNDISMLSRRISF